MDFVRDFGRHVTMHHSDWPELFEMVRTKESAQRYQTTLSVAILLPEVVGWERDYTSILVLSETTMLHHHTCI